MFDTYSAPPPTTPLPFYSPLHLQRQPPVETPALSLSVLSSTSLLEWAKPKPWYTLLNLSPPGTCTTETWVHRSREQQRQAQALEKRTVTSLRHRFSI